MSRLSLRSQAEGTESLRVGIIGCGRISRMHVRGYRRVEGVTVVAGADLVSSILENFAMEFGIARLYQDYHEMLATERPDIVSICTWPPLHRQMVLDAVRSGVKIIICEKPIATNLRETDEILAACHQAGTLLVVNHYRRFVAPYRLARELIAAGDIGALEQVHVISIGDLLTDGTHSIDLVRFYNDDVPIAWVFGQVDTSQVVQRYGHWTESGSLVSIGFENGVRGLMELGAGAGNAAGSYQRVLITGSRGSIDIKGDFDRRLLIKRDGQHPEQIVPDAGEAAEDAFCTEVEVALDVSRAGGQHPLSGESARDNLEVLIAAFESARRHALMRLPISTQAFPLAEMVDPAAVLPEIELQRRAARLGA